MSGITGISPLAPLSPLNSLKTLDPLQNGANPAGGISTGNGTQNAGSDFGKFLSDALQQVDALQKNADAASAGLATGQVQDVHTAMIALEKANLAMGLTVEVRNRVIDAYQAIMGMQI